MFFPFLNSKLSPKRRKKKTSSVNNDSSYNSCLDKILTVYKWRVVIRRGNGEISHDSCHRHTARGDWMSAQRTFKRLN